MTNTLKDRHYTSGCNVSAHGRTLQSFAKGEGGDRKRRFISALGLVREVTSRKPNPLTKWVNQRFLAPHDSCVK